MRNSVGKEREIVIGKRSYDIAKERNQLKRIFVKTR